MRMILSIFVILSLASLPQAATIYKWVDTEGVVNFTDEYDKIPSSYRDRVETREYIQEGGTPAHTQEVTPHKKEEVRTDIYGLDEIWWKEKVRPLKEQLREATANYETIRVKFMEKSEELSSNRFLSRPQHKTGIIELHGLKEEMLKYEAQIAEVNEMLRKLSKEAEEAKANPDWLK